MWRLDDHSVEPDPTILSKQLTGLSYNGAYIATAVRHSESTITITNSLSQTPSQFIDTGFAILGLALTGNSLLVFGSEKVVAWLLTEEGVVEGVFGNRRADHSDSIWTALLTPESPFISKRLGRSLMFNLMFSAKHQIGFIKCEEKGVICTYHTGNGELRDYPTHCDLHDFHRVDMLRGNHHLRHRPHVAEDSPSWPVSRATLREGWVKDSGGRHRFWLPVEWRISLHDEGWCHDITTLDFRILGKELVVIKF